MDSTELTNKDMIFGALCSNGLSSKQRRTEITQGSSEMELCMMSCRGIWQLLHRQQRAAQFSLDMPRTWT